MKNNKLDIFEQNAEFFERFNNSLEDTAEDRHKRTRFTVTGLENKVEFAVSNAQGRIKKAEDDAVDRLNQVNGITNDELISKSVGGGKWMREGAYGLGAMAQLYSDMEVSPKTAQFNTFYTSSKNLGIMGAYHPAIQLASGTNFGRLSIYNGSFASQGGKVTVQGGSATPTGAVWEAEVLLSSKTRTDKNNVLHSGTSTPLTTLNTSDMAQDVVDRDDITVTSGAVYRALDELRAEIAYSKGKLNE